MARIIACNLWDGSHGYRATIRIMRGNTALHRVIAYPGVRETGARSDLFEFVADRNDGIQRRHQFLAERCQGVFHRRWRRWLDGACNDATAFQFTKPLR